jgi:ribose transport system ATP-binding protein
VKDISFTATAGEVHALLGENGAGKSTLLGIASGDVRPDSGTVEISGQQIARLTPGEARRLGLALVHQHPAVLPELSVAENMMLAVQPNLRIGGTASLDWVASQLDRVGSTLSPRTRMSEVDIAQRQLFELARALAVEPRVLILDEPTAALTADLVELLFDKVREAAAPGAAVVYISHRLQEIRQIAQQATVMRDGEVKGSAPLNLLSDDDILRLIVGRTLTDAYPPKRSGPPPEGGGLVVEGLSGTSFYDVNMAAHAGEIVGIAGITGNGQSEFLRALAGLSSVVGEVTLAGAPLGLGRPDVARKAGVSYLSPDRQKEGFFMSLSVRENAVLSALPLLSKFGFVRQRLEREKVEAQRNDLAIRAASIDANIASLSGGNQQKVVLARALLADASLVLAEEPTAGVDVGARAEIYRILRDVADRGAPVLIVSSDGLELEGLCDRVLVFSRGHIVGELTGADFTEEKIGRHMVTSTAHRRAGERRATSNLTQRLRAFAASDYAPSLVLAVLILALGAYVTGQNDRFILSFNLQKMLLLCAALCFVGFEQMCVVFTGAIDLSVGPLVGLCVVIASFFFGDATAIPTMALGLLCMIGTGAVVGLINGSLVRFGNFTSVAATLGVYIIIQGISVLLRPYPDGSIDSDVIATIQASVGSIPIAFIAVIALAIALDIALRMTGGGSAFARSDRTRRPPPSSASGRTGLS